MTAVSYAQTTVSGNVTDDTGEPVIGASVTRRQDQVRFCTFTQPTADRYVGVWHNASAGDYNNDTKGYTNVYPIPYAVLNLNTNLKQNPGYAN